MHRIVQCWSLVLTDKGRNSLPDIACLETQIDGSARGTVSNEIFGKEVVGSLFIP